MKIFLLGLSMFALVMNAQAADTNAPAKPPRGATRIESDSLDADLKTRTAVYKGNVRVNDPQMNLTCDLLTIIIPATGGHPEKMIADGHVVMLATDEKGQTNRATGDKVIYTYKIESGVTNEFVELTGNPQIVTPQANMIGEKIYWDRANNKIFVERPRGELQPESKPQTNSPAVSEPKTTAPATNGP